MTITPEKLRELAAIEAADQLGRPENVEALRAAADEIERLKKLPAPSIPTSEEYQQAHNEAYQKPSFGLKP